MSVTADDGSGGATLQELNVTVLVTTWQNPRHACDVNDDGFIKPLDVLILISDINAHGCRKLTAPPTPTPPPFLDPTGDDQIAPIDVLNVINYINSHPVGSGEGEAVAQTAQSLVLEGLPSFDVPFTSLVSIAPSQEAGTAPKDAHPWATACQSLVPIRPANGTIQSASLDTVSNERDLRLGPTGRTLPSDDLDRLFSGLDAILPDIAEDVFRGWSIESH